MKYQEIIPYLSVGGELLRLRQYLKQEKVQKEVSLYVGKLKEKAKVDRFLTDEKQDDRKKF